MPAAQIALLDFSARCAPGAASAEASAIASPPSFGFRVEIIPQDNRRRVEGQRMRHDGSAVMADRSRRHGWRGHLLVSRGLRSVPHGEEARERRLEPWAQAITEQAPCARAGRALRGPFANGGKR